jgi:hypothetical protein
MPCLMRRRALSWNAHLEAKPGRYQLDGKLLAFLDGRCFMPRSDTLAQGMFNGSNTESA